MTLRSGARAIAKRSRYGIGLLLLLTSCTATAKVEPRVIQIQQAWQLQPGDTVGGRRISAGLGDVSIELKGGWVYAPFDGQVQPDESECVMFSSPQIPAYLVRLCGLSRPQLGEVKQGEAIGSAQNLVFATLRRLPDGKWAMVEPSNQLIEQTLRKP